MFKRILFPSKLTLLPFTFLAYSVFKNKNFVKMQADTDSQEKLLQSIDKRIYHLEKKLNERLEKDNFHLLLEEFPSFSDNNNSLLKKILTQDLWKKFYNSQTKEGFKINDIIQCGVDNQSDSIGAVAVSAESYLTFNEFFIELSSEYHKKDIKQNKFENESYPMLKSFIMNLDNLFDEFCVEFEVQAARNLSDFPFSPKITRGDRKAVGKLVTETLCKLETNVFPHKGTFSTLDNLTLHQNPLLLSAGVYRDWPNDRIVYKNNSGSFSVLINGEDHLNIIQTSASSDKSQKKSELLLTYVDFLEKVENDFTLAYNETFGFLNVSVKNIGSGIYFTFKFKISSQTDKHAEILKHFESNPDVTVSIKNQGEIFIAEFKNTNTFYNLSSFIIDLLGIKKNFID